MGIQQGVLGAVAASVMLLLLVGTFFSYQDHVNTSQSFDQLHADISTMAHHMQQWSAQKAALEAQSESPSQGASSTHSPVEAKGSPETKRSSSESSASSASSGPQCSDPSMVAEYLKRFGGKLPLQSNIKSVTIDVGQADTPITPTGDDHFVIGFEPIPVQYRGNQDKYGNLPNMLNMPFGAGDCDSWVHFNENNFKDTSSFLEVNQNAVAQRLDVLERNNYGDRESNKVSFNAHYNYLVPVIQLRHVVNLIPNDVELAFIKLDAQGFEGKCLMGLGDTIKRATRVMVEVTVTKEQFYIGSWTKQEVVDHMQKMGYRLTQEQENTYGEEQNLYFDKA